MTTYTVLPQDDSQFDVTVTDTATYTVTAQDDSNLDVTITDTDAVTITLQPVTISSSGGIISVNGLTGAPSGAVVLDSDDIGEGTTNLYFTTDRVDAHLNGGTGVDYTTGTISIGQDVGTDQDVTFNTVTANLYGAIHLNVKNDEGATINQGDPVYFKGVQGNNITVGVADANDPTKMPAFGVAATDANNNANLDIITSGKLQGIDTSAYAVNDELYVSTSGTLTTTRPNGADDEIQKIARVERVHATVGSIYVMGAGRSNDIPNLGHRQVFIGTAANGFEKRQLTEADISDLQNYLTAETNDLSSAVVWANVPDANITESSVTQHQAALTITESQISDLTHFSGNYNDLTNKPTIPSDVSDLTDTTNLLEHFSGDYNDLTNTPNLNIISETDNGTAVTTVLQIKVDGTPDDFDRARVLFGYDTGTSYKINGAVQSLYHSGDNWQMIFNAVNPENASEFNTLRIQKDYTSTDKAFRMTAWDDVGVAALPQDQSGILVWNTDQSHLQVNDAANYKDIAFLEETKNIQLDTNSAFTVTSDSNVLTTDISATGKYVPLDYSGLGGTYGALWNHFLAHQFQTNNDHEIGSFTALGSTDDGNHDSAVVLTGNNNYIKSLNSDWNDTPLYIQTNDLVLGKTHIVRNASYTDQGTMPLRVIRNNTDGGSTIQDDSKVDVNFEIADGNNDWNGSTFTVGGFSAVYDATNGNSFRLFVQHNDQTNSHEMEVNEGFFRISRPFVLPSYVYSNVPNAADHNGHVIRVIDGDAGSPCLAMSDGTNWKVIATLGNNISPT